MRILLASSHAIIKMKILIIATQSSRGRRGAVTSGSVVMAELPFGPWTFDKMKPWSSRFFALDPKKTRNRPPFSVQTVKGTIKSYADAL